MFFTRINGSYRLDRSDELTKMDSLRHLEVLQPMRVYQPIGTSGIRRFILATFVFSNGPKGSVFLADPVAVRSWLSHLSPF